MFTQFQKGFQGQVRIEIDWNRLASAKPQVQVEIHNPQSLSITLPWHRKTAESLESRGDWVTLAEIPLALKELHPDTRAGILNYAALLSGNSQGQLLNVPAWKLPDGRLLALDGCHRIAAMKISGSPGQVCLWTLEAPFDPELAPILARFGAPQSRRFKIRKLARKIKKVLSR